MLNNTPGFIARVGGVVLLMCLCRAQAQPLMDAAFAGDLPLAGWVILIYLVFFGTACALTLPFISVFIVICLIGSAVEHMKRYLNLILRDAAALRCGR